MVKKTEIDLIKMKLIRKDLLTDILCPNCKKEKLIWTLKVTSLDIKNNNFNICTCPRCKSEFKTRKIPKVTTFK